VQLGGLLSIIYILDFSDTEQASEFQLSFDAKVGNATGGADFHQKILQTATKASISVYGICSGVKKAPPFFTKKRAWIRVRGKLKRMTN
jgi:hypothetical protein